MKIAGLEAARYRIPLTAACPEGSAGTEPCRV